MYHVPCVLNGYYKEVYASFVDDSGFWGFHDAPAFYIGNGQYYTCLHMTVYGTNEIDLIWILVRPLSD